MIKGLRTVAYAVKDLDTAKNWYNKILGIKPYFDKPFYVGYNVGGYELGLDPKANTSQKNNSGVIAYWGVDDIDKEHARILKLGAKENSKIMDVGEGIKVSSVVDPFGNIFGLIYNPNFKAS
ncbi:VOC family protein [Candidatus Dependentiae bacterium]